MDPLNKEYQTNSETTANILYKVTHGYTMDSKLGFCEQTTSKHASNLAFYNRGHHCDLFRLELHGRTRPLDSKAIVEGG